MCMCLARGEWGTRLGLGFTNSGGTCGKWGLCFGCGGVGGHLGPGSRRVGWYYICMYCCESGFSVLMASI